MNSLFKGEFIESPENITDKLKLVKAFVFDWDGVFNSGEKNEDGCSFFNEVDSMGINLLRFSYFLQHHSQCHTAIITGENNRSAFQFAEREHVNSIYYSAKNKGKAISHFCNLFQLKPEEIAFVYDDVLDLSVASTVGLRIMVGRGATPLFRELVVNNGWVDYITHYAGGHHAVREATELLIALAGNYEDTILQRARFTDIYHTYFSGRNEIKTEKIGPEVMNTLSV